MTEGMSAVFGGRICISSIAAFLPKKILLHVMQMTFLLTQSLNTQIYFST